jgi:hypothetical protein
MPFTVRPHRRVPVCCPVTYQTGLFEGHGTVWDLSLTGWRFSGTLPLRIGEVCSLTVILPPYQPIYVAAGIVRWVRGEEYGVETLVIDDQSWEEMEEYLWQAEEITEEEEGGRRTSHQKILLLTSFENSLSFPS